MIWLKVKYGKEKNCKSDKIEISTQDLLLATLKHASLPNGSLCTFKIGLTPNNNMLIKLDFYFWLCL